MKAFLFLSRVGFLLNSVFLLCFLLRYIPSAAELFPQSIVAVMLVAGWMLSLLINLLHVIWWLYWKRSGVQFTQLRWVIRFNLAMFIFQLLFYFL